MAEWAKSLNGKIMGEEKKEKGKRGKSPFSLLCCHKIILPKPKPFRTFLLEIFALLLAPEGLRVLPDFLSAHPTPGSSLGVERPTGGAAGIHDSSEPIRYHGTECEDSDDQDHAQEGIQARLLSASAAGPDQDGYLVKNRNDSAANHAIDRRG